MKYAALLRGINVGGNAKVGMGELKKALEELGFENVKTLLNSGNVIFETDKTSSSQIEEKLLKVFGFEIRVIVRSESEIQTLIKSDPFKNAKVTPETRLYVTFLPEKEICNAITISKGQNTTDLMKNLEKEHGKNITTRNWNTILKIGNLF